MLKNPRTFALLALSGIGIHVGIILIFVILMESGLFREWMFPIALVIDLPGFLLMMAQIVWMAIQVACGYYGAPYGLRILRFLAILFTGPIATIYLGINYRKYHPEFIPRNDP